MAKRKKLKKLNLVKIKNKKQIKFTIWPNNQPMFLQNLSITFNKFKICNIYTLKKKGKTNKFDYCVMSQLRRLPWPINHAASVLAGVCNAIPLRYH